MPISFRKSALAFVIFATSATGAVADIYQIVVLDEAFLPAISYVNVGDQLEFINESQTARTVVGENDSWQSGSLEFGQSYIRGIGESDLLGFSSANGETTFEGTISFDEPPLADTSTVTN
ncbi:cupredoxin domain-containing protein [Roseobacter sp. GAI101]|uniref:cupredoxin domain-containing protein n=1 Tax=Roseobacter sp. (strain GAI101) TaxID=391589 RepID=UPI0001871414|nr:hypothetical protein [Roseobacter sp. GAI101]EEB86061.1 hypothetical protein RGAI101_3217 [Roseobacter sp. GAI101]